jgi:hypothetical protein
MAAKNRLWARAKSRGKYSKNSGFHSGSNMDSTQLSRRLLRAWRVRLSWRDDDPWHRLGARWLSRPGRLRQSVQPQKPRGKIGVAPSQRLRKCFLGQIGKALIHSRSYAGARLKRLARELCSAPGFPFSNLAIVNFKPGHEVSKQASARSSNATSGDPDARAAIGTCPVLTHLGSVICRTPIYG